MRPQEHYDEAERLLKLSEVLGEQAKAFLEEQTMNHSDYTSVVQSLGVVISQAQVHATLATIPFQQVQVEILDSVAVGISNPRDLR